MSGWNKSIVDFLHPEPMISVSFVESARNLRANFVIVLFVSFGSHGLDDASGLLLPTARVRDSKFLFICRLPILNSSLQ